MKAVTIKGVKVDRKTGIEITYSDDQKIFISVNEFPQPTFVGDRADVEAKLQTLIDQKNLALDFYVKVHIYSLDPLDFNVYTSNKATDIPEKWWTRSWEI